MGARLRDIGFRAHWLCALFFIASSVNANEVAPDPETVLDRGLAAQRAPEPGGLVGLPLTPYKGRAAFLDLITREAEKVGLPPDVADAVAHVESRFNPTAIGGVGEVGLMQIRPQTAAMLGYRDGVTGLFDPEVNVRYGVKYLAQAWQLAEGDLCRTLMKYRAGHGEERMSALSAEYCRRARLHLAAIGSPLAGGAAAEPMAANAFAERVPKPFSLRAETPRREDQAAAQGSSEPQPNTRGGRVASENAPRDSYARELRLAQAQARARRGTRTEVDSKRFWEAHEARIRRVQAKLQAAHVAAGVRL